MLLLPSTLPMRSSRSQIGLLRISGSWAYQYLHQKRGGQMRVAIDLAVWCRAEETIGDASTDILPGSTQRCELDLIRPLQSIEDAFEYSYRPTAEFAVYHQLVRILEAGVEAHG